MANETASTLDHTISWEASEYVHHEKNASWFALYAVAMLAVLGFTYFVLRDILSIIVVTMMAIALGVVANRKPHTLKYSLDDHGITIGGKPYDYSQFKSFSIMEYGAIESIYLEPIERFMPAISIYFEPQDGDKIVEVMGSYLPHREREPDLIDQLIHRIRL